MAGNKRRGEVPIPENCKDLMTNDQIVSLRNLESFGWSLKYVRRPKFEPVEVVLISADGESYALLREDGELDQETPVASRETRAEAPPVETADAPPPDDDLQALAEFAAGEPPSPTEVSPMAEPLPSSSNDALPDSEDIPPPKFLV
jgi:hypothetical protein